VITKVILATESFATHITFVRTFVGVRSFMYQQVVRLGEVTTAETTDKLTSATHLIPHISTCDVDRFSKSSHLITQQ